MKFKAEHEWEQGHSSLLRTRKDYGDPDDGIVEEDEVEEWLTREQVAEVCPSCADKMDAKGLCRIKSSLLPRTSKESRKRKAKTKNLRTKVVDNHGTVFSARLIDKPNGPLLELEADGPGAGRWDWYVKTLLGASPWGSGQEIGDELSLDAGQNWYVTGMKKLMKEVKESINLKVAGIIRDPKRVIREMQRRGIEIGSGGEVYFYPLSAFGVPNLGGHPFKVKDIEAAVRQTAHVRDGNEKKMADFEGLLDKLSRLSKFLKVGSAEDSETVKTSLDVFDMDIRALIPSTRVRSQIMKEVRETLIGIRASIDKADFQGAEREIDRIEDVIEQGVEAWGKQTQAWNQRRQLIMAIRNFIKKHPEMSQSIMTASSKTAVIPKSTYYKLVDPDGVIRDEGSAKNMRRELKKKPKGWKIYQSLGKKIGDKVAASR